MTTCLIVLLCAVAIGIYQNSSRGFSDPKAPSKVPSKKAVEVEKVPKKNTQEVARELRPCDSCGTPVPEQTYYPFDECPPHCELSAGWRQEYEASYRRAFQDGWSARDCGAPNEPECIPYNSLNRER